MEEDQQQYIQDGSEEVLHTKKSDVPHYHGQVIRRLFLAAGIITLIAVAFNNDFLLFSPAVTFVIALLFIFAAALTAPKQHWDEVFNVGVALFGLAIFSFVAIVDYSSTDFFWFLVRQGLVIIFAFALYFSLKTLRGDIIK